MLLHYGDHQPEVGQPVFLAPGSQIIGQVTLQDYVSIWFNAVLRGDNDRIHIGRGSNIQDNGVIHVDRGHPCIVGEDVTVGHSAILHACTVDDEVLVGMGAIVLTGAHIGSGCIIAAGTLISQNREIPPGSLVMGSPGRIVRQVTDTEREQIRASAAHYRTLWEQAGWQFR